MALPLDLLLVGRHEGQQRRNVEHDFVALEVREHRVLPCAVAVHVQASAELLPALQLDLVSDDAEEPIQARAPVLVAKPLFLSCLTLFAIKDSEFVLQYNVAAVEVSELFDEVRVLDLLEVLLGHRWVRRLAEDCLQRGNAAAAEEAARAGVYTYLLCLVGNTHQRARAVALLVLYDGHHARPNVLDEAGVVGMVFVYEIHIVQMFLLRHLEDEVLSPEALGVQGLVADLRVEAELVNRNERPLCRVGPCVAKGFHRQGLEGSALVAVADGGLLLRTDDDVVGAVRLRDAVGGLEECLEAAAPAAAADHGGLCAAERVLPATWAVGSALAAAEFG
mmetsp:Transcript_19350/g.74305  ORF Transcript_19350/g.74305 Transcript_19350/m.74305 type:complete len:335 (-) Transcript_19350:797-1801(-)